jgi:hypothetical protein
MRMLPVFLLVALAACGTDPNAARTTPASGTSGTPTVAAPSPSVAPTTATPTAAGPAEGTVVMLPAGVEFTTAAQINATSWLTAEAKVFMVSELTRVQSTDGACAYLTVTGYRVSDLVSGGMVGCPGGGGDILWGKTSSGWKLVFGGQYVPACSEIRAAGWTSTIPHDFIGGQCTEGGQGVDYKP